MVVNLRVTCSLSNVHLKEESASTVVASLDREIKTIHDLCHQIYNVQKQRKYTVATHFAHFLSYTTPT